MNSPIRIESSPYFGAINPTLTVISNGFNGGDAGHGGCHQIEISDFQFSVFSYEDGKTIMTFAGDAELSFAIILFKEISEHLAHIAKMR